MYYAWTITTFSNFLPKIFSKQRLDDIKTTLQIYTAGNGTHVKNVKVTSICRRYYNVEV